MFLSWVATAVSRFLLALAALCIVASVLAVLALRWLDPPSSAYILLSAQHHSVVKPQWIDLERISPWLAIAVIAAEDQRFPVHHGFDTIEIRQAVVERMRGDRLRGASTITQQLAKNLFLWPERSWLRKGLEAYFTVLLELLLPKKRILELYLNLAEFGPWLFGAAAAAAAYFSKAPAALTLGEAALLAAALPNPRGSDPGRPSTSLTRRAEHIRGQISALGGTSYLDAITRAG